MCNLLVKCKVIKLGKILISDNFMANVVSRNIVVVSEIIPYMEANIFYFILNSSVLNNELCLSSTSYIS